MGAKTATKLSQNYGLCSDVVPQDFSAEALANQMGNAVAGKKVLVVRASRGANTLLTQLTASGAMVREVVAYENRDVVQVDPLIETQMRSGAIDWVTLTSSAGAESLYRQYGDALHQTKIASLSPVTSETIRSLGLNVAVEANPFTIDSLVQEILDS